MEVNKIYCEDCRKTMENIEGGTVNLVLTSPPYNTGRTSKGENAVSDMSLNRYDKFTEEMSNEEYDDFTVDIFKGFDHILCKNGCVLYNISYGNENPTQMWTSVADVCRKTDFTIADCIVWKKRNATPNNVSMNKLTRICEFVFVFCRKSEYDTFHCNKSMAATSKTGQIIYQNAYNIIEAPNNDGSNTLNKATFSTEFVVKLLDMYAPKGGLVYDPFMGTGTTAIGCIDRGMKYIGSELSPAQCDFAEKRIKERIAAPTLFWN